MEGEQRRLKRGQQQAGPQQEEQSDGMDSTESAVSPGHSNSEGRRAQSSPTETWPIAVSPAPSALMAQRRAEHGRGRALLRCQLQTSVSVDRKIYPLTTT